MPTESERRQLGVAEGILIPVIQIDQEKPGYFPAGWAIIKASEET